MTIAFTVHGIPVPQGSKNAIQRHGRVVVVEGNRAKLRPWRATLAAAAADAMSGRPLFTGPVQAKVELVFPRPKSHFGTGRNADSLKASAPTYLQSKPDLDKLERAIGDALTGIVFRDDSQIAHWNVWKVYGEPARAVIELSELSSSSGFATSEEAQLELGSAA